MSRPAAIDVLLGLGVIAMLVVVVMAGVSDCRKQRDCRAKGGKVERYDCHMVTSCTSTPEGGLSCMTSEQCKWRCVGLPAEDPR